MPKSARLSGPPAAFAQAILRAYERRGVDPADALGHSGLTSEALADPDAPVGIEPFEALSAHAMRELDDEALGWFSRRLPWGSYGMLLRASLTSPTLDVALRRWCRHHGLLSQDVQILLEVEGVDCVIRARECTGLGDLREFCLVSLLRNVHGVACWLADSRIPLAETRFPFPAPAHAGSYARMFDGAVAFDAPEADLRFEAIYLRLPVVRDDAALRRVLRKPIPLMARRYRQDRLLSRRIAGFIASHKDEPPDAGEVASHFNISTRSLQRHLREEGTSLNALTSRARRRRAEDLLRRGLPLKRVAHLAGYGDESSFGRAFRRWTGQSPAEFRRSSSGDAAPGGA